MKRKLFLTLLLLIIPTLLYAEIINFPIKRAEKIFLIDGRNVEVAISTLTTYVNNIISDLTSNYYTKAEVDSTLENHINSNWQHGIPSPVSQAGKFIKSNGTTYELETVTATGNTTSIELKAEIATNTGDNTNYDLADNYTTSSVQILVNGLFYDSSLYSLSVVSNKTRITFNSSLYASDEVAILRVYGSVANPEDLANYYNKLETDSTIENYIASLNLTNKSYVDDTDETLTSGLSSTNITLSSVEIAFLLNRARFGAVNSSGLLSGGTFEDDLAGGVNYTTMEVVFKTSDSQTAPLEYFTIPAGNIPSASLDTESVYYAYADYNNGSPQVLATKDRSVIRTTDQFDLQRFYKNTSVIYIGTKGFQVFNFPRREHERTFARGVAERMSGAIIAEKATRYITITESTWYGGTSYVSKAASDSSINGFEHYYSYNSSTQTWTDNISMYPNQIDNTKYNRTSDGTLQTLGVGRYGVHWVYLGGSSKMSVIFGTGSYKLNEATAAQPPIVLPPYIDKFSVLVGRVIVLNGAATFQSVDSAFITPFIATGAEHNDLLGRSAADVHPASSITTNTSSISEATNQQGFNDSSEMNVLKSNIYGFEVSKPTVTYEPSSREVTITGNHYVWCNGRRFLKGTQTIQHTDVTGNHYIYYDSTGTLTSSTSVWDILTTAQIAYITYNSTKTEVPKGIMYEERHPRIMSSATHLYEHLTTGATSPDLFLLASGSYTIQPSAPTDADNIFGVSGGTLYDEDLSSTISDWTDGTSMPIFWREGVTGDWTWKDAPTTTALIGTTYPKYNQYTGGSWTTTEITTSQFINMWLLVTNSTNSKYRYVLITGQNVYNTLPLAQAASFANNSFGTFPFNECMVINQITLGTKNTYGSTGKFRIESVNNLHGIKVSLGNVNATNHNSLSGRDTYSAHPATALSISGTAETTFGTSILQDALNYLATNYSTTSAINTLLSSYTLKTYVDSTDETLLGLINGKISTIYANTDSTGSTGSSITLKQGTNVTITRSGDTFEISATGGTSSGGSYAAWTAIEYPVYMTDTDTITIVDNATTDVYFKAGLPIKFIISSVSYYAQIISVTSADGTTTVEIVGAPFTQSLAENQVYGGTLNNVRQLNFSINGFFADAADTTLLANDMFTYYKWDLPKAYLCKTSIRAKTIDSGATNSRVNVTLGDSDVLTSNSNLGLTVSNSWVNNTLGEINTSNYDVNYGDTVEIKVDNYSTNKDAKDLSVQLNFILE